MVPAASVIAQRIETKVWPLYKHTGNRRLLAKNDICLIYAAGKPVGKHGAQAFFGSVLVTDIRMPGRRALEAPYYEEPPATLLEFKVRELYIPLVEIRPLLDNLSFVPKDRSRWGAALRGGCRRISKADFNTIEQCFKKAT